MLKVTLTTSYDSAGRPKCGELYYQGSSVDFSILCSFCELRFEYDAFLSHFKNVHFEKSIRNAQNSNKKVEKNKISPVRRPSLLTELVMASEVSDDKMVTALNHSSPTDDHEYKDEHYSATKRTKETSSEVSQVNKKDLNEMRSQLKTELKTDLQKLEQRILMLENESISKKRRLEKDHENENKNKYETKYETKHHDEQMNKNDVIIPQALPKYAFRNVEHFKTYEKLFQNNEKKFAELVSKFLNHVQVENSVLFIKLCWRKILQDKAAQHLCWRGTPMKQAIGSSVITAAIKDAYVSKFPQTSSDIEFEKTCIVYFQTAKKRFDAQSSRWHRSR